MRSHWEVVEVVAPAAVPDENSNDGYIGFAVNTDRSFDDLLVYSVVESDPQSGDELVEEKTRFPCG